MKSLDERAQYHALREGGDGRAVGESTVPHRHMLRIAEAEFERDAAKHECQQHHQDREIDSRDDDRKGKRKGREKSHAAQNEPGLVAVPYGCDGIHHQVSPAAFVDEAVENADAQIEAVQRDIEEDAGSDDQRPDGNKIDHRAISGGATTGSRGRPLSIACGATSTIPLRTTRAIMNTPAGNISRYTTA